MISDFFIKHFFWEKSSAGVHCHSVPPEHRLRLTKCKDSENDSVAMQPRGVYGKIELCAEKVYNFHVVATKVHISMDWVCSVCTNWKSFFSFNSNTKLAWSEKWRIPHRLCCARKDSVAVRIRLYATSLTAPINQIIFFTKQIWGFFRAFCVLSMYLKFINSHIGWLCIREFCCLY